MDVETKSRESSHHSEQPWLDPKANPFIRIQGVTKKFGDFTAVDNVSLDIYKGELFALLGGSGCGKTTLLRMLAGFETPTAGHLYLDGQDMTEIPPYQRPVNMMFQSYALFPHMTVEKNVGYGLKHEAMTDAQRKERIKELLDLVKLTPLAGRKPHQLSGGQRQRVALARSLAKQPKVLLLDEPLGALDKKLREQTQFELMNIQHKLGVTFIVVTHDQEEAMTLATRIAVMDQGLIRQIGTPTEIYEFPRTRFVADFIGSINIFDGEVKSTTKNKVIVSTPALGADVTVEHAGDLPTENAKVSIAVRPEKISIERKKPGAKAAGNAIAGKVIDLGYFGKDSLYRVKLASGTLVRVNAVNSRRAGENERVAVWEDDVWLTFAPSSVIILTE
ncbi:ABC transporter ATP-binding protein [Nordella sp. HKS 07]|uniref:ABC transporter ATP-binding protein n=1 Tax=Nordella sp. HKS 07 TaxID=2712222 RepID=UPI0013E1DFC0|nr:ABC transporter ATP-binding protein [Nordella sp. HKS 07]QIG49264.1 ABC transporter ATP-binding protein [Nordella sp. HKS 07]